VDYRSQDNPRSLSYDGVPLELEVLGFRGISAPTGLISWHDWPTQDLAGEDCLRSARASALCVDLICINILFGDFAGEEKVYIGKHGRRSR